MFPLLLLGNGWTNCVKGMSQRSLWRHDIYAARKYGWLVSGNNQANKKQKSAAAKNQNVIKVQKKKNISNDKPRYQSKFQTSVPLKLRNIFLGQVTNISRRMSFTLWHITYNSGIHLWQLFQRWDSPFKIWHAIMATLTAVYPVVKSTVFLHVHTCILRLFISERVWPIVVTG